MKQNPMDAGGGPNEAAGPIAASGAEASSLLLRDVSKLFRVADGGTVLAVDRTWRNRMAGASDSSHLISSIGRT